MRRGIEATSIDLVASELSLTKGAVYANFTSKAALIEAVAELGASSADVLNVLLRPDLPLRERLRRLGRDLVTNGPTRQLVLLDLEYVIYAARNRRWGRQSKQQLRKELGDFADRFRAVNDARGEKSPIDEETLLYLINLICRGIIQELMVDPKALTRADIDAMFLVLSS